MVIVFCCVLTRLNLPVFFRAFPAALGPSAQCQWSNLKDLGQWTTWVLRSIRSTKQTKTKLWIFYGMYCRCCSNYIFFLDLTHDFNGFDKDNCTTRRETFRLWDLVPLLLRDLMVILLLSFRDIYRVLSAPPWGLSPLTSNQKDNLVMGTEGESWMVIGWSICQSSRIIGQLSSQGWEKFTLWKVCQSIRKEKHEWVDVK